MTCMICIDTKAGLWTLDWTMDWTFDELEYELNCGLDFGLGSTVN